MQGRENEGFSRSFKNKNSCFKMIKLKSFNDGLCHIVKAKLVNDGMVWLPHHRRGYSTIAPWLQGPGCKSSLKSLSPQVNTRPTQVKMSLVIAATKQTTDGGNVPSEHETRVSCVGMGQQEWSLEC